MRMIAGARASDGFGNYGFGFRLRYVPAGDVYFGEILPQFVRDFHFALMRKGSRPEGANADRFAVLNASPQERFDGGFLVR